MARASLEKTINQVWYGPRKPRHMIAFVFLIPLSILYSVITAVRRYFYYAGLFTSKSIDVPIVVIGNLSVGGTGKTPLTIYLARLLSDAGLRVGVVSRGYGNTNVEYDFPLLVNDKMSPLQCGDEPLLIKRNLTDEINVVVDPKRARGAEFLVSQCQCDVIICDDGLQHYALSRDIEIVVVDGFRMFGNGFMLPAGPMREPIRRAKRSQYTVVNFGNDESKQTPLPSSALFTKPGCFTMSLMQHLPINIKTGETCNLTEFEGQPVHLVAGIGNPERFFVSLENEGIDSIRHPLPDHHPLTLSDVTFEDEYPVIMTEKDAVKLNDVHLDNLWYLPIVAKIPDAFAINLAQDIKLLVKR